ncbi:MULTISPECIES: hypothetical protein [Ralstonia]|uniref:hypothetical protein n=1 Tax=Ralstonia TaxID=48736 RepID=UPI00117CB98B|nr:hypothetical protein [Ralstonia pickettii]
MDQLASGLTPIGANSSIPSSPTEAAAFINQSMQSQAMYAALNAKSAANTGYCELIQNDAKQKEQLLRDGSAPR